MVIINQTHICSRRQRHTVAKREPETFQFASRNTKGGGGGGGGVLTNAADSFAKRSRKRIVLTLKQVAGQPEPVSNDRFLGDLNLKTDVFSVHALLF